MPTELRKVVCPVSGRRHWVPKAALDMADANAGQPDAAAAVGEGQGAEAEATAAASASGADGDGDGDGDGSGAASRSTTSAKRSGGANGHEDGYDDDNDADDDDEAASTARSSDRRTAGRAGARPRARARPNGSSPVRHAGTTIDTENIPPPQLPHKGDVGDDEVIGAFDEEEDVEEGNNGSDGEGDENGDESAAAAAAADDDDDNEEEEEEDHALSASVSLRPFVLLLHIENGSALNYELLRCEFDSDAAVSDLLDQLPTISDDEYLREQTYVAVADQSGMLWSTALTDKLARFHRQTNAVILPIPKDVSVAECSRVAGDVLSRPDINALVNSLTLIFHQQNGSGSSTRRIMQVARDAKFGNIIKDYADVEGMMHGTILLYFDERRIKHDDTPVSLELDREHEEERIIGVMVEQGGG